MKYRTALASLCMVSFIAFQPMHAQERWPNQPIKLVIPFPPGGGTDGVSRFIAAKLAGNTGWTIIAENKPGAGGVIGLDAVAKAKPDGYTLAMGQTANLAINPGLQKQIPYDALKDFTPIALIAGQPVVLVVRNESPYRSLADLVAASKRKPGSLTMATSGSGSVGHLAGEMFATQAGIKFVHVPYKGAAPAMTDLLGGQTDFLLTVPQTTAPMVAAGKLRALGVTSDSRLPILPNVPTVAEQGYPGFQANDWKVLVGPAGMPPTIVKRLHAEVEKVLGSASAIAALIVEGSTPLSGTSSAAGAFIRAEHARWVTAIRQADVKPE